MTEQQKEPFYIVRTDRAGVFFCNIESRDSSEAKLKNVRKIWYWSGAAAIEQLAMEGTKNPWNCKLTVLVPELVVLGIIQVIPCTDAAVNSLSGVAEWKIN